MNSPYPHVASDSPGHVIAHGFDLAGPIKRKWPVRYRSVEALVIGIDLAIIHVVSLSSALLVDGGRAMAFGKAAGAATIVSALLVPWLKIRGMYRPQELTILRNQLRSVCAAWIIAIALFVIVVAEFHIARQISYGTTLIFAVCGFASLALHRAFTKAFILKGLQGGRFAGGNIVLITDQSPSQSAGLSQRLTSLGFWVNGLFSLPPPDVGPGQRKQFCARVIEHVRGSNIEEIIIEADPKRWRELQAYLAHLRVVPFPVVLLPVGTVSRLLRRPTRDLGSAICIELQRGPLNFLERATKRVFDIAGASLSLFFLAPLLLVVAIVVKLDSPGPVFFRQRRCGFNGRSFSICKFRTMTVLEDGAFVVQAQPADRRITRVGKWLRRTSIDELPQLVNVLEGSMSLVGPRPHAIAHDGEFDKVVRNYGWRQRVKPGLTGWAQIHGCRGPTPTPDSIERRVEYDLWYIDNWSLWLDLSILVRTPKEIFGGRNAY